LEASDLKFWNEPKKRNGLDHQHVKEFGLEKRGKGLREMHWKKKCESYKEKRTPIHSQGVVGNFLRKGRAMKGGGKWINYASKGKKQLTGECGLCNSRGC